MDMWDKQTGQKEATHSSMSESKSEKRSLGKNLMLLFASELKTRRREDVRTRRLWTRGPMSNQCGRTGESGP